MPREIKTDARLFASDCYMTDTYELVEIAARGCPPSIIDEPTPEQTPWRRRSIRLHEDAPRRTRPDVLISHAHESPAGLPPPLSFIICFSRGSIVSARRVAVFGRTRSRNQTRSSHQWHVLPCSRSGLRLSFVSIKQNGSRRAGVGHPMKAPGAWVACLYECRRVDFKTARAEHASFCLPPDPEACDLQGEREEYQHSWGREQPPLASCSSPELRDTNPG